METKLNIYQINSEYLALAEQIMAADGELLPKTEDALNINKSQLETKGRGYGFIVKATENN